MYFLSQKWGKKSWFNFTVNLKASWNRKEIFPKTYFYKHLLAATFIFLKTFAPSGNFQDSVSNLVYKYRTSSCNIYQEESYSRLKAVNYYAKSSILDVWQNSEYSFEELHALKVQIEANSTKVFTDVTLYKKWSFSQRISSVNVSKSAVFCGSVYIYWRNP